MMAGEATPMTTAMHPPIPTRYAQVFIRARASSDPDICPKAYSPPATRIANNPKTGSNNFTKSWIAWTWATMLPILSTTYSF